MTHDSQRRDRILQPETGQFSPHFAAIPLPNYTVNWRKGKRSAGENSKNPVETAPRGCRFLYLVVGVESVLIELKSSLDVLHEIYQDIASENKT